jgi:hypothetical protein
MSLKRSIASARASRSWYFREQVGGMMEREEGAGFHFTFRSNTLSDWDRR